MKKKPAALAATAAMSLGLALGAPVHASGISDGVVRLGLLLDMAGPYSDIGGAGSVLAARMAVEDFGGTVLGKPIEVIYADHQNKPDIASTKAREWFDMQKVDAITDVASSATSIAAVNVGRAKNKPVLISAAAGGTSRLTNEDCSPISVHWTYNTQTLANVTARAVTKAGGDSWFFITADYTFGHSLEKDTADLVKAAGGQVLGSVRHPLNASDFSSFIMQAQNSKAKVIGLANAGADTISTIKAANDFGLVQSGKSLAGLLMYISDVHALGLRLTQGMMMTEGFYWDLNDETRAWSKRFFERHKRMPTSAQAGEYSAVTHYLKAVKAAGTDETGAVMAKMRELPVNDVFVRGGTIRPDGAMVHPMYLAQVKKPSESRYPWDYLAIKAVVPQEEAFQPLSDSRCPLVKR
ncbi:ABC transporter permease [Alicycliphilus denitrificans]|uniref:ABC transporter substrate-binding protein n=1 Tax=Alicycliphilus denitrificans TaxID=179636 RepID=UPI0009676C84|nr:ABC transporter substrate-binding protein [Alicycliphilus denitrificans]MBN9574411.1 ABC transporter substrate-binding protein [Alicycliphilus denitrificans]OJW88564.1 MAG: ABC transporter permease [Alicycliphilus sp. 69-12]BCN41065.1 ABC transporter permease [Alicycliphilus denitrificans]